MPARTTLVWINRLLWTVLVGVVLLLGAVVTLGRHYIHYVETYQDRIVDEVQRRTGLHLSVGRISGQWQRLTPQLVIEDLRLYNPQKPDEVVLSIDEATLRVGLFRSIDRRTLALKRLEGQGVSAVLDEISLGHWRLRGFPGGHGPGVDALLNLLLAMHRAQLTDSHLSLNFFGGGQANLTGHTLSLEQAGSFRRLHLALAFAQTGAPLELTIEARGDPRDRRFSAQGYAAFTGVDLTPILPLVRAYGLDFKHGRIDGSAWLDWRADGTVELRGKAAMPMLDLAALTGRPAPPLRDIKTEFLLRDAGGRRQLWLPEISGQWGQVALQWRHLLLELDGAQPDVLQLSLPSLVLEPLRDALLEDRLLPEAAHDALATLAPTGTLRNVHLTLPRAPGHWDALRLRAEFSDIAVAALGGAPSVTGANGYVDTGVHGGVADFAGDDFSMGFPHVYHEPLHFDRVRGQIGWRLENGRVLVDSGPLRVHGDAGDASVLLGLDLRTQHDDPVSPQMTLMVGMRNSDARYRDRFIPYTLKPELLEWLHHAIGGGRLPVGGFLYRGSLVGTETTEHTVQLFLDVRDGELTYHPDWPALHDLQAALWLDDNHLLVESPSARISKEVATSAVRVEMEPEPVGEWLTVTGQVSGRDDDLLQVLRASALHRQLGGALDSWHWRGPAEARLDLGIPIGSARPAAINVDAELGPGQLTLTEQRLTLNEVRGPLLYRSAGGLQSPAIRATLYGKPVTVRLASDTEEGLTVDADGRLAMSDLQAWLEQPLLGKVASGDTDFKLALHFPAAGQGGQSHLEASSSLRGVTIDLPAPYAKAVDEALPLTVNMPLTGDRHVDISLGERADLSLAWEDKTLQNGVLRLGRSGRGKPVIGQFLVTGTVAEPVELDPWLKLFSQLHEPQEGGAAGAGTDLKLQIRALHLPEVQALGQTVRDVRLFGLRGTSGWVLRVQADRIGGAITVPESAGQPWQAHLDYLRLPAPAPAAPGAPPAASGLQDVDPSRVTPVDLHIDHFWRGDEDWGWLGLKLRPVPGGLSLEELAGELRGIRIEPRGQQPASLSWLRNGDQHHSRFEGRLAADNIGKVLERWGYERVLTAKTSHLEAAVDWSGPPDAISRKNLNGDAAIDLEDGRFLKASTSATGALKVVGIFNFANLLRRLQLDFSDLFRDGVSFNKVEGGLAFNQGVFSLARPLDITSPSSRFRLSGQVDFNTDQTDMELVATLPVASNLPWVAALAGGLPAAAGVYVASKLFQNQVDKFSSAVYDIKGPWSDPEVKFRRIFDDKTQPGAAPPAPAKTGNGKS